MDAEPAGRESAVKLVFREKIMLDTSFIYVKKMLSQLHLFFTRAGPGISPTWKHVFLTAFTNDRVRFVEPAWQTFHLRGAQPMHQLKLVLPLAGLLIAGQALAHKAPHVTTGAPAPARLALVQAGASPAALIDGVRGRSVRGTSETPAAATAQAIGKSYRYTHSH
ncbi:hypothetical protein LQ772_01705 [Frateuria edaphi]|uniref:hypothetical protein n=1 Tax=Frateuria edaphi TaxID=2898793 RepID=UPI001E63AB26|nr:hypothetical protein [Frateuria edaphi]UGB46046.1 hypothetical protein LQ772_01705 [Frateuria edaphi]